METEVREVNTRLQMTARQVREDNTRLQKNAEEAKNQVVICQCVIQCLLRLLQFNAVFVTVLFYIARSDKSMYLLV